MKGLLIKDLLTLSRQARIFLGLIVVYACIPQFNMTAFAVVYASILPITALAYDENCKWDTLAAMLPYTPLELVGSKYIIGTGAALLAALVSALAQLAIPTLITHKPLDLEALAALPLLLCVGLCLQSLMLPLMFRYGVNKGRMAFYGGIAAAALLGVAFGEQLLAFLSGLEGSLPAVLAAGAAFTLAFTAVSVWVSQNLYRHKER